MKENDLPEMLERRVLRSIQENNLLKGQERLLVAVSGGPDSVCLIHILANLCKELDISLHIAHLDHQLRGKESTTDAEYVSQLAKDLNIPATIEQRDVTAYQIKHHLSPEEAAREVRYRFLSQAALATGCDYVTVGHTADDNIETILMHLIRGTGIKGLRGLQPVSHWPYENDNLTLIRPLLLLSRQEAANYCEYCQVTPRLDSSNLSLSPLRNRIRLKLVPLLESYNPQVAEALLRTARIAGEDISFLDKETALVWDKIIRRQEQTIILDKKGFLNLHPALKRHLLRQVIEDLLGNLKDVETRHIEIIMNFLAKPAGKALNLPGGLVFSVDYDRYLLILGEADLSPFLVLEPEANLTIPGETTTSGWHITTSIIERTDMAINDEDSFTAYLDMGKTGTELLVRPRRPGDRFQPLGMRETKKLGEFMIDERIPVSWRKHIPIVSTPHGISWIVGFRIDERFRVDSNTSQILRLKFVRS
ncbi:tRNA lysidine(34) synthetase TilS [Chloroflexota bacterium]